MRDFPRERLERLGPEALTTKELIAILLGRGVKGNNVFALAQTIAEKDLEKITLADLLKMRGIGKAQACKIVAAVSIAQRIHTHQQQKIQLSSPKKVFEYMAHIKRLTQEQFYGLYVDTRKYLVSEQLLFKGTVDATVVHPRDVFRQAIQANASGVIIVHNHPSGLADPSDEDIIFTKKVMAIGEMLHIPVLDHVIVGNTYWSFIESENND